MAVIFLIMIILTVNVSKDGWMSNVGWFIAYLLSCVALFIGVSGVIIGIFGIVFVTCSIMGTKTNF